MASKSGQQQEATAESIEELLDTVDKTLDRVKTLYEQYFLGIQKQPPTHLHTDVERKLRELSQLQIRNTALRYRFATLQQKFGSYNTYWRRTLRQIENGTYARNLAKISRQAIQTGEEIPEEILAAMPKRMREQVKRDREAALAQAQRRHKVALDADFAEQTPVTPRAPGKDATGAHLLSDEDFDFDSFFASVANETDEPTDAGPPPQPTRPTPVPPPVAAARVGPPGNLGRSTGPLGAVPPLRPTGSVPAEGSGRTAQARPHTPSAAPSQMTRPLPFTPAAAERPQVPVESMQGPFPSGPRFRRSDTDIDPPRQATTTEFPLDPTPTPTPRPTPARPTPPMPGQARPSQPVPRIPPARTPPPAAPPMRPPPGMTDADVNALYAKYVKAKEMVGEQAGPGAYGKLLKTINTQAPKIMEQYKAKGVDFSVVVKDNQVIIRAKPKP